MLMDFVEQLRAGQMSFEWLLFTFLSYAMVVLLALPVHELAHGYIAYRLGDNTAKWNGRLTLNPFAHLDIFGTLMIFLFGVGYAKPVPVDPRNFRNYKTGMALTALAGPVSNLLMAFLSLAILRVCYAVLPVGLALTIVNIFFVNFALINISLAVFNLLPIPPLDGFRIVANVLPAKWSYFVNRYQMYITLAVMLLVWSGALSRPIGFLAGWIYRFFIMILGF